MPKYTKEDFQDPDNWPKPKRMFEGISFPSSRGLHFDFDERGEAEAFYQECIDNGFNNVVIESTMVIIVTKKSPSEGEDFSG